MKMAITLETIYQDIRLLRSELHTLLRMLDDEGELTDKARQELKKARKEMACGEFVSHEEIMAKYG